MRQRCFVRTVWYEDRDYSRQGVGEEDSDRKANDDPGHDCVHRRHIYDKTGEEQEQSHGEKSGEETDDFLNSPPLEAFEAELSKMSPVAR